MIYSKTTDLNIICHSDGQILFKSPVSSRDSGHFLWRWKTPRQGKKKPDSGAFFCRLCQYTYDGLLSRQDIRYLHICWISCRLRRTAQHCPHCHASRQSLHCNRESSPLTKQRADLHSHDGSTFVDEKRRGDIVVCKKSHITTCPVKATADRRSHIVIKYIHSIETYENTCFLNALFGVTLYLSDKLKDRSITQWIFTGWKWKKRKENITIPE